MRRETKERLLAEWRRLVAAGPLARHGHEGDEQIALRSVGGVEAGGHGNLWQQWWREEGAAVIRSRVPHMYAIPGYL